MNGVSDGVITSGLPTDGLLDETLKFIFAQLTNWRDDPTRPHEEAEECLNAQVCKFLNARARHEFPMVCFHHEERQTAKRRIDLSAGVSQPGIIEGKAYSIYDPFLVIEGKRLPAPRLARQKEYVVGDTDTCGGIQRFKLGLHGATLRVALMLGYIQDRSPTHWYNTINGWIMDLAREIPNEWEETDVLFHSTIMPETRTAKAQSRHTRHNGIDAKILIHHFWIELV